MPDNRDPFRPILEIENFWFTDSVRPGTFRKAGACQTLKNTSPNLSGGERIRRGYKPYSGIVITNAGSGYLSAPTVSFSGGGGSGATATVYIANGKVVDVVVTAGGSGYTSVPTVVFDNTGTGGSSAAATAQIYGGSVISTGITQPAGSEILKVLPVHNPTNEDVHLWLATSGEFQNPFWGAEGKRSWNVPVNESVTWTNAGSFPAANQMTTTTAAALGLNTTTNYYKGWRVKVGSTYALCTAYSVTAGTATWTFVEDVNSSGLNWTITASMTAQAGFHEAANTFTPTYNTTLASPPCAISDNSIIFWSGGLDSGAASSNVGLISKYISRTYFTNVANRSFSLAQSYVCQEYLHTVTYFTGASSASATANALPSGTYYIATALVYDGFQVGQLTIDNSVGVYSSTDFTLDVNYAVRASTLDKRATGILVLLAIDEGVDTSSTGRKALYQAVKYVNWDDSGWSWSGTTNQRYIITVSLDGAAWANRESYVTASGIVEVPSDIGYTYSSRTVVGGRHFLTNFANSYSSSPVVNRTEILTNPVLGSGSAIIGNAGIIAYSMFSNEEGIYRLRVEPTVGSKITSIHSTGIEELLVLKDRGTLVGRIVLNPQNNPDFIWQKVSDEIGCTTLNQSVEDDDGWIYFNGYEDVYRYRGGRVEKLIERADRQDWLYTYREVISKSSKESSVLWYLPENIIYFDIAQTGNAQQFALYPDYIPSGWRQVQFKMSSGVTGIYFKWATKLKNGTTLVMSTESPAKVYEFSNPSTGTYYYKDYETTIPYRLDTGSFLPSQDVARDTKIDRLDFDRHIDSATQGTLDIDFYVDDILIASKTSLDKTATQLRVYARSDGKHIGHKFRWDINSNSSSPETQNAGTQFTINGLYVYGDTIPRTMQYDINGTGSSSGGTEVTPQVGTISGKWEFLITAANTWESFTFDTPFTRTYSSADGNAACPTWRIDIFTARTSTGVDVAQADILFQNITLSGFQARSPEPLTLCKYGVSST